MEQNKIAIIINGKGGCGKDTICDILCRHFATIRISTITRIKEVARMLGWKEGREDKDRKFLSDLKLLWSEYNNGPFEYAYKEYQEFLSCRFDSNPAILVFHVREPGEIAKLKATIIEVPCYTLLIRSKWTDKHIYGNMADDLVENYPYDFVYENYGPLEDLDRDFMDFFYKHIMI